MSACGAPPLLIRPLGAAFNRHPFGPYVRYFATAAHRQSSILPGGASVSEPSVTGQRSKVRGQSPGAGSVDARGGSRRHDVDLIFSSCLRRSSAHLVLVCVSSEVGNGSGIRNTSCGGNRAPSTGGGGERIHASRRNDLGRWRPGVNCRGKAAPLRPPIPPCRWAGVATGASRWRPTLGCYTGVGASVLVYDGGLGHGLHRRPAKPCDSGGKGSVPPVAPLPILPLIERPRPR